jgi:hypothetical protein
LKDASKDLQAVMMYFMQEGMKNPNAALAGSTDALHMFGHVCFGLMWSMKAKSAQDALDNGTDDPKFYNNKLATGRYYMARMLPATKAHQARILSGPDTVMALDADAF